jgi:hypothetical protein
VNDEVFVRLPIPTGRVDDDHLSAGERAVVEHLAELPPDRLRVVVRELLSLEGFRLDVRELLLGDGGGEA